MGIIREDLIHDEQCVVIQLHLKYINILGMTVLNPATLSV